MDFKRELEDKISIIDRGLEEVLEAYGDNKYLKTIVESIEYSLFTGGKRIRPVLALEAFDLFNDSADYKDVLPFALAVEMIHTYSLVHDDLPAMDDDDERRGKPTNHIKYGEAMAILAGDGLLNMAFETAAKSLLESREDGLMLERKTRALYELGNYSGINGMIGGQVVDLHLLSEDANKDNVGYMYRTKTSALIQLSLVLGATIAGAREEEIELIRSFGYNLGMAYQIKDDFLDLEEDSLINKVTYLSTLGIDKGKEDLGLYSEKAIGDLKSLNKENQEFLLELVNKLEVRNI